jgi:DNA transposition AAA+ family ATPase
MNPFNLESGGGENMDDSMAIGGGVDREEAREAMDRINAQNRILEESRMIPRDKPLTMEQSHEVATHFQEYIKQHGMSASDAAKQIGYSKAVLSEWTGNTYKGNRDKVTHAVNDWMERDAKRRSVPQSAEHVATWLCEDIKSIVDRADKQLMMAAITAPAGSGKTTMLKYLTKSMRGVYIYCEGGMTAKDLYLSLASALGWHKSAGSRAELLNFIVTALTGTRRIIFLDEAHQLGHRIGSIRAIYDRASVPIVMAGTHEIVNFLLKDRASGCGQFASRCIVYNAADQMRTSDGDSDGQRYLFDIRQIEAFFAQKKIRLAKDALQMVWAMACLAEWGTLRFADNVVKAAMELEPGTMPITRRMVMLGLELQVGRGAANDIRGRSAELSAATPIAATA